MDQAAAATYLMVPKAKARNSHPRSNAYSGALDRATYSSGQFAAWNCDGGFGSRHYRTR